MGRLARFDPGTCLAWAVDRDRGYRQASGVEWRFVEIKARPGADGVSVSDLVGEELPGPPLRLIPLHDGMIELRCEETLVTQAYGEERALSVGLVAEVPFGSVVRAGSLLVAPLYAEQVESIREERMTLPVVPHVGGLPRGEAEGDDDLEAAGRARRKIATRWLLAWAFAFAAAVPVAWIVTHLALLDSAERGMPDRFESSTALAFAIGQWFGIFFVGLPVQIAMGRWRRTPGASEDLAPRVDSGRPAAVFLAIVGCALVLLLLPWALGLLASALLLLSCGVANAETPMILWAGLSAALGAVLSIAFCIFSSMASQKIHTATIRWLVAERAE